MKFQKSTGIVSFPGELAPADSNINTELNRSGNELAYTFEHAKIKSIKMGNENLSAEKLLHSAIQHEGIHQGQYYVALKLAGIETPRQWQIDWNL